MKRSIDADAAATTPLSRAAFEAMKPYLFDEYANASQPYSFARGAKRALADARETVAALLGAEPDEIYFTSGGTESDNWALKGTAFADPDRGTTIASAIEHHAVLRSLDALARLGRPSIRLEPTPEGLLLPSALQDALAAERAAGRKVRLVSIMTANNEIGSIQPIRELAEVARASGALFHTDAVQGVGRMKIDVRALGVDLLSASAHKFNGPKGVGFLYVRRGVPIFPYLDGGAQERGRRAGTENVPGIVGTAVALKENCDALAANEVKLRALESRLLDRLRAERVAFRRNGAGGLRALPGLLSLSFPGADGEAIFHRLDLAGIRASTGSACDGAETRVSHVLKAIGLEERFARGTIRLSLSKANEPADADAIARALAKIVASPRP